MRPRGATQGALAPDAAQQPSQRSGRLRSSSVAAAAVTPRTIARGSRAAAVRSTSAAATRSQRQPPAAVFRRPSTIAQSGSRRSVVNVGGDSLFLMDPDHAAARPDIFEPPARREGYAGFYNTYSSIRLQDVRASLVSELEDAAALLETLEDSDVAACVHPNSLAFEHFENVVLDIAQHVLLAAAAAETTILQRRLRRHL
jgi:hypothetical protein